MHSGYFTNAFKPSLNFEEMEIEDVGTIDASSAPSHRVPGLREAFSSTLI
jgi:hypothetical protein